MAWPHEGTDWFDILDLVEPVYIEIAHAITQYEKLILLCRNKVHQKSVAHLLKLADVNTEQIQFQIVEYNDTWTRDYGPLSILRDGKPCLLDFIFNGWGNKFKADKDNHVNQQLREQDLWSDTDLESISYILEGGSIDTDGEGTLLTTSACLLNSNRQQDATKGSVTEFLTNKLGCKRILWLDSGYLAGDDTDSHIDTLARFCSNERIIYMSCDNSDDEHYQALKQMETELKSFRTMDGRPYQLFPVNIPSPIFDGDQRLPASYVNFLIINSAVLAPIYGDTLADQAAITQITNAFPQHRIIPIDCKPLIMQHGSLHCVTMQLLADII